MIDFSKPPVVACQPHPHAALMAEYAKDAAETERPWEGWEWRVRNPCSEWKDLKSCSRWSPDCQYRRKGEYITINGYEVRAPLKKEPDIGTTVFYVSPTSDALSGAWVYRSTGTSINLLKKGLLHLTKEDAIAHAKALLSFTEGQS